MIGRKLCARGLCYRPRRGGYEIDVLPFDARRPAVPAGVIPSHQLVDCLGAEVANRVLAGDGEECLLGGGRFLYFQDYPEMERLNVIRLLIP